VDVCLYQWGVRSFGLAPPLHLGCSLAAVRRNPHRSDVLQVLFGNDLGRIEMNRRETVQALLGLSTLGSAISVLAQPTKKVWRIGILASGIAAEASPYGKQMIEGLAEDGFIEGRDFVLDVRHAEGRNEQLPALAAELVRNNVDLLIADSTNASIAAQNATATIPIVFIGVSDPIAAGFTDSLARPRGNMTGMSNFSGDLRIKRFELLKQLVPNLSRIAVLSNPKNPYRPSYRTSLIPEAEKALGVKILIEDWDSVADIQTVVGKLMREGAQAISVSADAILYTQRKAISEAAIKFRIPCIAAFRPFAEVGCLMTYGVSILGQYRQIATYLSRIMKGAKPGDLPIQQPTKLELIVNMKTARALGLTVPSHLLLRADEVIQ
jgi:putative ABC transport system substrate-binding protein